MVSIAGWSGLAPRERDEIDHVCWTVEDDMSNTLDEAEARLLAVLAPGDEAREAYERLREQLALLAAHQAYAVYRAAQIAGPPAILTP